MNCLADAMTREYASRTDASSDQKEIYKYGVRLLTDDVINFSMIISISALLGSITYGIVFLSVFCVTRRFSGGYHAKTRTMCRVVIILTFLLVFIGTRSAISESISIAFNVFSIAGIAIFAPIGHVNKPLNGHLIKMNKLRAVVVTVLFSLISTALIIFGFREGTAISLTLTVVVVLLLIKILKHQPMQKEKNHV